MNDSGYSNGWHADQVKSALTLFMPNKGRKELIRDNLSSRDYFIRELLPKAKFIVDNKSYMNRIIDYLKKFNATDEVFLEMLGKINRLLTNSDDSYKEMGVELLASPIDDSSSTMLEKIIKGLNYALESEIDDPQEYKNIKYIYDELVLLGDASELLTQKYGDWWTRKDPYKYFYHSMQQIGEEIPEKDPRSSSDIMQQSQINSLFYSASCFEYLLFVSHLAEFDKSRTSASNSYLPHMSPSEECDIYTLEGIESIFSNYDGFDEFLETNFISEIIDFDPSMQSEEFTRTYPKNKHRGEMTRWEKRPIYKRWQDFIYFDSLFGKDAYSTTWGGMKWMGVDVDLLKRYPNIYKLIRFVIQRLYEANQIPNDVLENVLEKYNIEKIEIPYGRHIEEFDDPELAEYRYHNYNPRLTFDTSEREFDNKVIKRIKSLDSFLLDNKLIKESKLLRSMFKTLRY